MRGKDQRCGNVGICSGITPAYAGKRTLHSKSQMTVPGSPPPMRGKGRKKGKGQGKNRITPAYAGKRWITSQGLSEERDHPRLCGEKAERRDGEKS